MSDSLSLEEQTAALARHAPHLAAVHADEGLRAQLRHIEDLEALAHAKFDLASEAGLDAANNPTDYDKFVYSLRVAREEAAATIDLETIRVAYITDALVVAEKAHASALIVPAA